MSAILVAMDVIPFAHDLAEVSCPHCGERVVLHQPDTSRPERLLGTCPACPAWLLIDGEEGLMITLPDVHGLRTAWRSGYQG